MKKAMAISILLMTLVLVTPSFVQAAPESTFVAMVGRVVWYGKEPAFGWLGVFAEVGLGAEAGVFWTLAEPKIASFPAIFTVYAARLVETTTVELDYMGKDFYISGLWDVYNITFVYDESGNLVERITELIVDDGSGELNVVNNWTNFTVDIAGIDLISGMVTYHCIKTFEIPRGDWNLDGTIDIYDLVHVARAYGDTPGIGGYYFDIDFNFDFTIDIYDLTTLAANLGESY